MSLPATLGGLRAQVVSWLKGDTVALPFFTRRPYDETRLLLPTLIALNNAGLFTYGSQPGDLEPTGRVKRAWVHGWCESETLDRLREAIVGSELLLSEGYRPPGHPLYRYPTNMIPGQNGFTT